MRSSPFDWPVRSHPGPVASRILRIGKWRRTTIDCQIGHGLPGHAEAERRRIIDITVFIRYPLRPMAAAPKTKRDTAEALRRAIREIEDARSPGRPHLPLGVPEIDRSLPGGGLRAGCIQEVGGDEAATGFCAVLLGRAASAGNRGGATGSSLLWLVRGDDLHAPGLVRYGIGAGRLLIVSGLNRRIDMLWAMEEALRCRALAGVVAEAEAIGRAAGRRLMLAAEGTGVLGLVLSRGGGRRRGGAGVSAAVSRWRVTTVPGLGGDGGGTETRWRVEMLCHRGGRPAEWLVGWGNDGRSRYRGCSGEPSLQVLHAPDDRRPCPPNS